MENVSPEEKLLQLIRKRPKKEKEKNAAPPETRPTGPAKKTSLKGLRIISLFRKRKKKQPSRVPMAEEGRAIFALQRMNQALAIGLGVVAVLFLVSFFWEKSREEDLLARHRGGVDDVSSLQGKGEGSPSEETVKKPYTYYGTDIEKRNIFGPSLYTEIQDTSGEIEALLESIKDLNLLGIISGKKPQAIIENKKEGKTHFVNKGDRIGLLQIEEIMEDKVILNYQGEQVDLTL